MSLGSLLLDLLYPPKCPFCGRLLKKTEDTLCASCASALPRTGHRTRRIDFIKTVYSPFYYEDPVRSALLSYKFSFASGRSEAFGRLMAEELRQAGEDGFDVITWVPLSPRRRRKRGYDQARLLAETLARELGKPVRPLLKKIRNVPAQSGIRTPEARRANVSGCYAPEDPETVKDSRILLVDDIVTTGATLSECARVLMLSGAENVVAVTLAAARREK